MNAFRPKCPGCIFLLQYTHSEYGSFALESSTCAIALVLGCKSFLFFWCTDSKCCLIHILSKEGQTFYKRWFERYWIGFRSINLTIKSPLNLNLSDSNVPCTNKVSFSPQINHDAQTVWLECFSEPGEQLLQCQSILLKNTL